MAATITVSASYGTQGALVGREVAERLGLTFLDRAIPVSVAEEMSADPDEGLEMDWQAPGRLERFMSALAHTSLPLGYDEPIAVHTNLDMYRRDNEALLRELADSTGGVILGRASSVVLRGRPDVLHIRLDGAVEARIRQTARRRSVEESAVREEQRKTDDAREAYLHLMYGATQYDQRLYDLVVDATTISRPACVDLVLRAALDRLGLTAS